MHDGGTDWYFLGKTGDGVAWNDPAIDADEMNEMLWELGDDE